MSEREQNAVFANAAASGVPVKSIQEEVQKDFNITLPSEMVPLPSGGKCYPTTSKLHGMREVGITPMTAVHENILSNRALHKKGTVVSELLRSILVEKSVDPRSLLSGDRNALIVAIRAFSYGTEYSVSFKCPDCETTNNVNVDLAKVVVKSLDIDPVTPGTNEFVFKLPRLNKDVHFKFLTGADEEDIHSTSEQQKKLGITANNDAVTRGLHYTLLSVDGVRDRAKLANFIKLMPAFDSNALRRFIRENEPGMDMRQDMVCPVCDHLEEKVDIELNAEFFWPGSTSR